MSSLTEVVNVGASGIEAATAAMQTVSNNTANATTPGYNVESVAQTQLPGTAGGPGSGVMVTSIQRAFDEFIFQQIVQASGANQASQVLLTNSMTLAAMFPVASGGAGGLGAGMSSFFGAAGTLSQAPSSIPDRQAMLSQANSLTGTFQSTANQLATSLDAINGQLTATVQQINSLTQQIASLNQQIAQSSGNPANALLDQRDQLVQQLSQQIGVSVLPGSNGMVDVYTSGGAALVSGTNTYQLAATASSYGDGTLNIVYAPSGQDLTQSLSGGTLGGLLTSRTQLIGTQDSVGALAAGLAASVNTQQSLGLDLNGNLGQPLFSVAGPAVYASTANTGSGSLSAAISDTTQFVPGDFILTKTTTGFEATNIASGQTTTLGSGPTLNLDGMTITVSGTIQTGDSFKLEPTAQAASSLAVTTNDPNAIAAAAAYVATPGANLGNVAASVGGPVTSGGIGSGAVMLPSSAFGQTLSVVFTSASDFEVRNSSGSVLASGSVGANSGAQIAVAYPTPPAPAGEFETIDLSPGAAAAGDSFTLSPGGPGSNGNIAALAGLANQQALSGQTLGGAYAALVTTVGNYGQEAQVAATAAQGVLSHAQQTQQSISGVNLDEEAAHLVAFQQAYQASAQVIAIAQSLFQTLISAI